MGPVRSEAATGCWTEAALAGRGWKSALEASGRKLGARTLALALEDRAPRDRQSAPHWCGDPGLFVWWNTISAAHDCTYGALPASDPAFQVFWARADAGAQSRAWIICLADQLIDESALRANAQASAEAAAIRLHLTQAEQRATLANEALEALSIGVALISPEGRIENANRACQRILARGDGLTVNDGRLSCPRDRDRRSFAKALSGAFRGERRRSFVRIARERSEGACLTWFAPSPPGALRPNCLMVVIDSDAAGLTSAPWRSTFDLSEAELHLAKRLIAPPSS